MPNIHVQNIYWPSTVIGTDATQQGWSTKISIKFNYMVLGWFVWHWDVLLTDLAVSPSDAWRRREPRTSPVWVESRHSGLSRDERSCPSSTPVLSSTLPSPSASHRGTAAASVIIMHTSLSLNYRTSSSSSVVFRCQAGFWHTFSWFWIYQIWHINPQLWAGGYTLTVHIYSFNIS